MKIDAEQYGVIFTFDDGTEDYGIAGAKEAAKFYAKHQKGEVFPIGVNPMLLNAEKAEELRDKT